ncbi:hypothetical protein HZH68_015849 [Vespula germanica]|uniref:Uncharacterized protein n=1 Tax=Vespula germanica TaxID=30212 RepID=A0A834MRH4_VESGE|nr:hypothetical protein HZH68_015849 [Vespula germanica]
MDGSMEPRTFDLVDCIVFIGMLGVSAVVGVYQAYRSRKNPDAVREYLVGSQNMSIFPISMSLIARRSSTTTLRDNVLKHLGT